MEFIIHKEEGYACSMRLVDESLKPLDSINHTGGATNLASDAWNKALLKDAFMFKLYDHSDKMYMCIKVDLDVKFIVVENYNGYTTKLVRNDSKLENAISHEDYLIWKENHVAKWIDNTWVYVHKNYREAM